MKETIEISKLEKKSRFRVLTVEDVGNALDQALEADQNGGVFIVFPDAPVIQFPEVNKLFIIPLIAWSKLIAWGRPEWKRVNGIYAIPCIILITFVIFYILLCLIF